MRLFLFIIGIFITIFSNAQDVVPKAKTKEQRKAERKKMTLEQRIEEVLPVDVNLPSANLNLPGNNKISSLEDARKFVNETVPNYGKDVKERTKKTAKQLKKVQSKTFDGKNYKSIAVEKKIWRQKGNQSRQRYIEFYVLKDDKKPMPYHREMTWYEEKGNKSKIVENVLSRDPKTNTLLHGPYKEYRGSSLVKEGNYYLGVKDGRWMEYDAKDFTLTNKETFTKGFYAESQISYYGGDSTKIKEVVPMLYGKVNGNYMRFYEDGTLAERGKYDDGKKIEQWIEFYEGGGNRRRKVTQYPNTYFDATDPFVLVEYDDKGKVTFETKK